MQTWESQKQGLPYTGSLTKYAERKLGFKMIPAFWPPMISFTGTKCPDKTADDKHNSCCLTKHSVRTSLYVSRDEIAARLKLNQGSCTSWHFILSDFPDHSRISLPCKIGVPANFSHTFSYTMYRYLPTLSYSLNKIKCCIIYKINHFLTPSCLSCT